MLQSLRMGVAGLAIAGFVWSAGPAEAGCELVKATHSAGSHSAAAQASQQLTLESAYQVQQRRGWSSISLRPKQVEGDPFWKAVRPGGVPQKAKLNPDIVTTQFYTTCFTGVVVPYVCTTGSVACGN
jgi:hypothetical protein